MFYIAFHFFRWWWWWWWGSGSTSTTPFPHNNKLSEIVSLVPLARNYTWYRINPSILLLPGYQCFAETSHFSVMNVHCLQMTCFSKVYVQTCHRLNREYFKPLGGKIFEDTRKKGKGAKTGASNDWRSFYLSQYDWLKGSHMTKVVWPPNETDYSYCELMAPNTPYYLHQTQEGNQLHVLTLTCHAYTCTVVTLLMATLTRVHPL